MGRTGGLTPAVGWGILVGLSGTRRVEPDFTRLRPPASPAMPATDFNVKPGSPIQVEIVKAPTNAAAKKTLVRLFRRDPEVKREQARLRKVRDVNAITRVRSGRPWKVAVPTQDPVEPTPGTTHRFIATYQALQDLKSVARFVSVKPA